MCRPDGRHVLNNQGTDDYVLTLFLSGLTAGMVQREPQIRASFPTPENSQPDSDVDWDFLGE